MLPAVGVKIAAGATATEMLLFFVEAAMVVSIEKFLQKAHRVPFRVAKIALPSVEQRSEPDDKGPDDDPPNSMQLAA